MEIRSTRLVNVFTLRVLPLKEFEAYTRTYKEDLDRTHQAKHLCITDGDGYPRYTTKAYIER